MSSERSNLHRKIQRLEHRVKEHEALDVQHSKQVRALAVELLRAERRERKRIARLLHDHIQQLLVFVKMKLGQMEDEQEHFQPQQVRRLQAALRALEDAIQVSRDLTVELSPPVLFESGLNGALQWLGKQMHRKHGLKVHVETDVAAEPSGESTREFLFEAASELLFNVVKHAETDEAWVWLRRAPEDHVAIIVEDHGVGLDEGSLQERTDKGYGLGRVLDRLHVLGGSLRREPLQTDGTRLIVEVPGLEDCDETLRTPIMFSDGSGLSIDTDRGTAMVVRPGHEAKIRVLLVDDHEILRAGLSEILKGFEDIEVVGEASNGRMAVNLAHSMSPDVVIMDYDMPVLNGVAATRQIKQELPKVQVLGLTMYKDDGIREIMLDAGASQCMAKGCRTKSLVKALREVSGRALNSPPAD